MRRGKAKGGRGLVIGAFAAAAFALLAHDRGRPKLLPPKPTRLDALGVRGEHPRIWLDPARVVWLREKVKGKSSAEVRDLAGGSLPGMALAAVATDDPGLCRSAFATHVAARPRDDHPPPLYHLALLYDWCHDALTKEERAHVRVILIAHMLEEMKNGRLWRSFHNSGHTSAMNLTLSALALYGDDPVAQRALVFLRAELEDMLLTFDELFPDGEWAEGGDYARHASHHGLRTFLALKTATGTDLLARSPHLRNIAQYVFYAAKPNGLMFPGDDNDFPFLNGWDHRALLMHASEYRDPHVQWFLNHAPYSHFALEEKDRWEHLLFYDATIPEKTLDDLPLARIFRGKGLVLARTRFGFDDRNATWLAFTNGDYFGDHDHLDVNSFQIYRGGELAIDSGRYDDDWDSAGKPEQIARSQLFNYYQRTIAHNTMLVRDPNERQFMGGLLNDGGQIHHLWRGNTRNVPEDYAQGTFPSDDGLATCDWTKNPGRWERGNITAYEANADFVYVRGDGTKAYAATKLSTFVRDLVFVRPALVFVIDHVVATSPSFEKTWLLHTVNEPTIARDGSWFEVTEGEGRLFGVPVAPDRRKLAKVGGPEDAFLVDGVRFKVGPASALNPSPLHLGEIPGAWRIEEKPAVPNEEDWFANILLLTSKTEAERPAVDAVTNDEHLLSFRVQEGGRTVTFRFDKATYGATLRVEKGGTVIVDRPLVKEVVLETGRQ